MKVQFRSGLLVTALAVMVSLFVGSARASAADSINLHHAYKTGETAKFGFNVERVETTDVPGQTMEVKRTVKHDGEFEMKVVDASAKGVTIGMTLTKLKSSVEDPNRTLKFDSAAAREETDAQNPLIVALRPIVGVTVTFKFDEKGAVVECASDAELVRQSQFTEFANQLVGEEWAKFRWGPVFYPKAERGDAKVGDSWRVDQSLNVPMLGRLSTNMHLAVESIKDRDAKLAGTGEYTLEPSKTDDKGVFRIERFEPSLNMEFRSGTGTRRAEFREKFRMVGDAQGMVFGRASETTFTITRSE